MIVYANHSIIISALSELRQGVDLRDVLNKVAEGMILEALPPHEFLQVTVEQHMHRAVSRLVRLLGLLPHALDVVRGGVRHKVHEVHLMIDCQVLIPMLPQGVVCGPEVRHYRCSREDVLLDHWEQGLGVPVVYRNKEPLSGLWLVPTENL